MNSADRKKIPRLFALFLAWIVILVYFIWGMIRSLSLFTLVWRSFVLALVIYFVVYYYFFWIVSRVPAEDEKAQVLNHESD